MAPWRYLTARTKMLALAAQIPDRSRATVTNSGDVSRINIYDEIGVWGVNASDFVKDFALVTGKEVHVHINSPGGDLYDGLAIYQTLKAAEAKVVVHVDGVAASAASFIAMAGDEIIVARNGRMMIHDASTLTYGNAADHEETTAWLNEESDNIADIYAQRAGGDASEWRQVMKGGKWYSGDQAVTAGLADSVHGADDKTPSVAASLFKNPPGGPALPADSTTEPDDEFDFGQVSNALKEAFQ